MAKLIHTLLLSLLTCNICVAETLTLLIWEEYLSEAVVEQWQAQTGHELKQIFYDNEEKRDTLIAGYSGLDLDIVVFDELGANLFGEEEKRLTNLKQSPLASLYDQVDPKFQNNCGQHALPYLWGTYGVVYRTDKLAQAPNSWNFIFDPPKSVSGHIGLIDDYTDSLAPALFRLGHPINTEDEAQLKSAFELTKISLGHILTYEYSVSYLEGPNADSLHIALGYSGDQYVLNEKLGKDVWNYTTLSEGTIIWTDCLAILENSPRRELAYNFLKFIYQAEIAAENSETLYVATPLPEARSLQSQEIREDTSVYPPVAIMEKAQSYTKLSAANILLRNRINSSLIKIHESP